ncbi:hypothetical protein ACM66B_005435 [Microbotryomycetes sp. NB124-2]
MSSKTLSPTPTLRDDQVKSKAAATASEEKSAAASAPDAGESSLPTKEAAAKPPAVDESLILRGKQLAVVFIALLLSIFLTALDQTILAPALPRIASDFNAFTLQGWVSSAFILTQTGFILIYGPILRIYSAKYTLLVAVVIFEVGSVICGAAPDVYVLIFGRALSGVGAAGIFTSAIQILGQCTRLEDRPKLFGLFGAVFGLSSVIGPFIGGGLTDASKNGWRWIFYLNVPIGALTVVGILFLLKSSPPLGADLTKRSIPDLLRQTLRIDWVGAVLIMGAVTCLVLALQWGGNTKPWKSAAVLVPLVLSVVTGFALLAWQKFLGERAMVPPKIIKSVSVVAIVFYSFTIRFCMLIYIYYLPIFYQVTRAASATRSSIDIIAFMVSVVASVIISGQVVGRVLYRFWPFLFAGPMFLAVGAGLLYTVNETTDNAKIIGYQILAGVGVGTTMQNSLLAMQAEFKDTPRLLAQATGLGSFSQFLGGTVGLAVAQAVFGSVLGDKMRQYAPNAPIDIIKQDPLSIYTLSADQIQPVIRAYVQNLQYVFILGVPFSVSAILLSLLIKNIRIKDPHASKSEDGKSSAADVENQQVKHQQEVEAEDLAAEESGGPPVAGLVDKASRGESEKGDNRV